MNTIIPLTLTVAVATLLGSGLSFASDWSPATSIDPGGLNNVNTSALEGCPIESPDGRMLFFASNRTGGQGGIDIWVAFRDGPNQPWSDPVNLPPGVNSASDDFCPTPLPGGDLFFVSRRPGGCGESGDTDIYYAKLHSKQGWLQPVHLGCEVNSPSEEFSPSYVPAGGGMLFFSSNRDETHKVYVSLREPNGLFGAPVEVVELNAPGFNTLRPNVSQDGREIVFDSDRHGGFGGPDIWVATRASVVHAWSAPVNLGPNVHENNTPTRDLASRLRSLHRQSGSAHHHNTSGVHHGRRSVSSLPPPSHPVSVLEIHGTQDLSFRMAAVPSPSCRPPFR